MTRRDFFELIFGVKLYEVTNEEECYAPFWDHLLEPEDIDMMSERLRRFYREE